jgi:hypothetical protein
MKSTRTRETALHRAAAREGCRLALLCHMVKARCDLFALDKWDKTAAQRAEANGNTQVAQFLEREAAKLLVLRVNTCATHVDATKAFHC